MNKIYRRETIVKGVKTSYFEKGKGPVILFIHSWPTSSEIFIPLIKIIPESCHCVALDLPGFGNSQELPDNHNYNNICEHIINFLRNLHIKSCGVVGISFGAALAVYLAAKYPEIVKYVIANSPPIHFYERLTLLQKMLIKATDSFPATKQLIFRMMKSNSSFIHRLYWGGKDDDESCLVTEEMVKNALKFRFRAVSETLNSFLFYNLKFDIESLSVPLTLLVGSGDKLFLKEKSSLNLDEENYEYIEVPKENHLLILRRPDLLKKLILNHI